jgi:hypothetical protein
MRGADLQGANLQDAKLQGADLKGALLQGADIREAALWRTAFDNNSNLSLADLRGVSFDEPTDEGRKEILAHLDKILDEDHRKNAKERAEKALAPQSPPATSLPQVRIDQPR